MLTRTIEPRAAPVGTSCGHNELPLGRYCDRTTGLVTTWFEKCVPLGSHATGKLKDRSSADGGSAYKGDSVANYIDHACPVGHACVQAYDQDVSPEAHVFCKATPSRWSNEQEQVWLEPFGSEGRFFRVELSGAGLVRSTGDSGTTIKREFVIHTDSGAILQAVLYDPMTMRLLELPIQLDVTVRETQKPTLTGALISPRSSTWQVDGQSALVAVDSGSAAKGGSRNAIVAKLSKRVRSFGRRVADGATAIAAVVGIACLLVVGQAVQEVIDRFHHRGG